MKTHVWRRFDVQTAAHEYAADVERTDSADGEYVLAQDAIDREAVLQAQIRTLETQLKDARRYQYAEAGGAINGQTLYTRTEKK